MASDMPAFLQPFLWSYDLARLDLTRDKKRIITNVLNYGSKEATDWLFSAYPVSDIEEAITHPLPGEWKKKSIHFWAFVLGVPQGDLSRNVANAIM